MLTGFLGAGKTTLLNRLLKDPALADTAVIINEFGEIGLDHLLVEYVGDNMVLLQSGCLCCTLRGDLVDALENIAARSRQWRCKFSRVLLETTGLADPAPVLHTAMAHPYLVMRYRLDGVVTVVDAVNGGATLDEHPEAVKQAAVADRIVLSKTDLATRTTRRASSRACARSIRRRQSSTRPKARPRRRAAAQLRPVRSGAQDSRRQEMAGRGGLCRCPRASPSSSRRQPA